MYYYANTELREVSAKQAYEWVKTRHWNMFHFLKWLDSKGIHYDTPLFAGPTLIHRADGRLAYEWVRTRHWSRWQFTVWLNSFL